LSLTAGKCGAKSNMMTPARCDGKLLANACHLNESKRGEADLSSFTVHHTGDKVHTILPHG